MNLSSIARFVVAITWMVIATLVIRAQEPEVPATEPPPDDSPAPTRAELEARFAEEMGGVRLIGHFTQDDDPPDAPLREDAYTIHSVEKLEGDQWRMDAGIHYGGRDLRIPMKVDVLWAGDTPMISITDLKVPFLGTFTARVLFQGGRYAGTWSGMGHGGHLFGVVEKIEEESEEGEDEQARSPVHWPSFRGNGASGVAEGWATPQEWSVDEGAGVRWRAPVAGLAHSSPVIWGDRIFLTSAVKEGEAELKVGLFGSVLPVQDEGSHLFQVLCIDKRNGQVRWIRTAHEGEADIARHPKGSHAASTPATDGERVVAMFGSEGLYCYDMQGELLWERDFGRLDAGFFMMPGMQWGYASSPVIHGDRVLVQCDVQDQSFLTALSIEDGSEIWRTDRDEVPTWGSPTVIEQGGRAQVVVNGFKHMGGYDLATGDELWRLAGGGDIPVPTPIAGDGLLYLTNSHGRRAPILAISVEAEGELALEADESEFMEWSTLKKGNYMQTPLLYEGLLYCCRDSGVLACYDAQTGELFYSERLSGTKGMGFTASGVAADGKLYFTSEEGEVYVVRPGRDFEVLAVNELGERCMATPAISEGTLYFRTEKHLVAVGGGLPEDL